MKRLAYIACLLLSVALCSCIHNDIPYPRIQANIRTIEARDQEGAPVIDSVNCTVTIPFAEEADIYAVRILSYTLSPGASIVDNPFGENIDLSKPLFIYLHLYQDWLWKIVAKQDIERYFEVSGQMGETTIDVPARRVVVYVRASADLNKLQVLRAKLGARGSTMEPAIADGGTIDASKPVTIKVTNHDRTEEWTLYVQQMEEAVKTVSADAWTCVAWVSGRAEAGLDNGVEYRLAGSEEWTRVPAEDVTENGGSFTACIKHLSPQSAYEARAYSESDYGDIIPFTTGSEVQLPNSDFEWWWLDKKVWCPWKQDGEAFWGTGNPGAATLGQSNVYPTEDSPSGSGYAACLETRFVGVGPLGKLAAGSIYAGYFVRTDGTNGVLSMGRPFTERPVRLRGQYKYTGATINYADAKNSPWTADLIGQPDSCIVWCALVDCDTPVEIRTNPANRALFDPEADYVIAYGKMEQSQTITDYIPFDFELKYKSTSRVPKYILLTASSSKYGDYFTGGAGAVLYLDDYHLEYDY
ncbi:MAG: PCMD domain-containing protein [Muribaculaceae bacterium]|nr:PCMD domain-containing protein [Muribaculaceae bacterium]